MAKLLRNHLFLIALCCLVLILVLVPYVGFSSTLAAFLGNYLPLLLLGLLIYFVTGRRYTTLGILLLLLSSLWYLNDRKLDVLDIPLSYNDSVIAGEFLKSPGLMLQYASPAAFAAIFGLIALLVFLYRREAPGSTWRYRGVGIFLTLAAASPIAFQASPVFSYYAGLPVSPWYPEKSLEEKGLIASLLQEYCTLSTLVVPRADEAVINAYQSEHPLDTATRQAPEVLPDLVIWLSEGFFDPGILNQVDRCALMPNFCQLSARFPHGDLVVPTYAGQTVRTEFELLTGIPMLAVAGHQYPYLSLVNRPTNSIAWTLKELGYTTAAIHNHKRAFWRRNLALPDLGFDQWLGVEDLDKVEHSGYWAADKSLTQGVIRLLEEHQAQDSSPVLIFAISMEGHGPWGKQPGLPPATLRSIETPTTLGDAADREFREFFYHLGNADDELARMADIVLSRERPTAMLFFGDHLPGLRRVYGELGFRDGQEARAQKTIYLLLSNQPGDLAAFPENATTWQLSTYFLNNLGLLGDSNFAWFNSLYASVEAGQGVAKNCQSEACATLRQFQFKQLESR